MLTEKVLFSPCQLADTLLFELDLLRKIICVIFFFLRDFFFLFDCEKTLQALLRKKIRIASDFNLTFLRVNTEF